MELENLKLKKANENTVKISNDLSENVTAMIHTLTEKKERKNDILKKRNIYSSHCIIVAQGILNSNENL